MCGFDFTPMSSLTVKEVNGIEFYVSNDGKQVGVSQNGLARLCGVTPQTISQRIIKPLQEPSAKLPGESLELLRSGGFNPKLNGQVLLIDSSSAAAIITYYAFESRNKTQEAKFSLRKFASMGMETWIKQIVGFAESASDDKLLGMMQELMSEVKELRADVKDLRDFKRATVTLPGLQQQFDGYAHQESSLDSAPFTLSDWLKTKGITLDNGTMKSFGRRVAELYKVNRQAFPPKVKAYHLGKKGRGDVRVYTAYDTPMLETALQMVLKSH